ncbi:class I SAM-dependent methyltransferase [uncultured Nocardioides sp.]|uniref:class I SAM-dependent methyltransferase n=1 Tax=uncultured Nocardioides sp. TaxID=198441 RepID=UPI00261D9278|nr:class I SAM-dependent methyltransferase [uncultured Nocardioides sp.]
MTGPGAGESWRWDPSLYAGAAAHYVRGRTPYPRELADRLADELGLDGTGRLLDLGCGPGSLTLLLAPLFAEAVGLDADADMLTAGRAAARAAGVENVAWVHRRAEDLGSDLGVLDVVTLAQSFHWMRRDEVAALAHDALRPGGTLAHVHATTHEGVRDADAPLPHPRPPRDEVDRLVARYLGPRPRAGRGTRDRPSPEAERGAEEAVLYRAAGFDGPTGFEVPGRVVVRTVDEVASSVFSLSYAAPHLFGDRLAAFDRDLRARLHEAAGADGLFSERLREIRVDLWRR